MLVLDTLPGLVNSGGALNVMDSNWEKMAGLTELPSAVTRSNAILQIQSRTTAEFWSRYREAIFDPRDRQLYSEMETTRTNCRALAGHFFDLVNAQRLTEADQFLQIRLTPAFNEYRSAVFKLFMLNTEIGNRRADRILALARWLPELAALVSMLVFGLGFLFGLRGAFRGLELAFHRRFKR